MAQIKRIKIPKKETNRIFEWLRELEEYEKESNLHNKAEEYFRKKTGTFYFDLPSDYHLPLAIYAPTMFMIERYLGDIKGKNILQIGCNYGPFVQFLRDRKANSFGLDTNQKAAGYSASNGEPLVIAGDAMQMPFASESIDCVVSKNFVTADYLMDKEIASILNESWRVLKKNGKMVLCTAYLPDWEMLENSKFSEVHKLKREDGQDLSMWPCYAMIK